MTGTCTTAAQSIVVSTRCVFASQIYWRVSTCMPAHLVCQRAAPAGPRQMDPLSNTERMQPRMGNAVVTDAAIDC